MSDWVDEVEARASAATPGPWGSSGAHGYFQVGPSLGAGWCAPCLEADARGNENVIADTGFVEHARTDVPRLVAEVRALRAKLELDAAATLEVEQQCAQDWKEAAKVAAGQAVALQLEVTALESSMAKQAVRISEDRARMREQRDEALAKLERVRRLIGQMAWDTGGSASRLAARVREVLDG